MAKSQGAALDRKKFFADPIMVTTIVVLIAFLTLFILYPLAILLVDSFVTDQGIGLGVFRRIMAMSMPGTVLSQLGMKTRPSKEWARAMISQLSAM